MLKILTLVRLMLHEYYLRTFCVLELLVAFLAFTFSDPAQDLNLFQAQLTLMFSLTGVLLASRLSSRFKGSIPRILRAELGTPAISLAQNLAVTLLTTTLYLPMVLRYSLQSHTFPASLPLLVLTAFLCTNLYSLLLYRSHLSLNRGARTINSTFGLSVLLILGSYFLGGQSVAGQLLPFYPGDVTQLVVAIPKTLLYSALVLWGVQWTIRRKNILLD
ncbi:hypothetical protein [Deinococcus roseus]|uniref:ABC transporter permease n=1 Tax=Deinococcus roseus TaxID=392414 RepID=A0ABQ2DFG9_9DEIO|nr:hypothetical protein [Deinococcus roseus]GGJ54930.1 hypothetical protein GCM10008938_46250 [Deinococcus roseus]